MSKYFKKIQEVNMFNYFEQKMQEAEDYVEKENQLKEQQIKENQNRSAKLQANASNVLFDNPTSRAERKTQGYALGDKGKVNAIDLNQVMGKNQTHKQIASQTQKAYSDMKAKNDEMRNNVHHQLRKKSDFKDKTPPAKLLATANAKTLKNVSASNIKAVGTDLNDQINEVSELERQQAMNKLLKDVNCHLGNGEECRLDTEIKGAKAKRDMLARNYAGTIAMHADILDDNKDELEGQESKLYQFAEQLLTNNPLSKAFEIFSKSGKELYKGATEGSRLDDLLKKSNKGMVNDTVDAMNESIIGNFRSKPYKKD